MQGSRQTHEEEVYAVIYQVILTWLYFWWRRKVHPVVFTGLFDVFVLPCQPNDIWVKFHQIVVDHGWGVACRVAGYHDGH